MGAIFISCMYVSTASRAEYVNGAMFNCLVAMVMRGGGWALAFRRCC